MSELPPIPRPEQAPLPPPPGQRRIVLPPHRQRARRPWSVRAREWIRRNLFPSPGGTLLTLLSAGVMGIMLGRRYLVRVLRRELERDHGESLAAVRRFLPARGSVAAVDEHRRRHVPDWPRLWDVVEPGPARHAVRRPDRRVRHLPDGLTAARRSGRQSGSWWRSACSTSATT